MLVFAVKLTQNRLCAKHFVDYLSFLRKNCPV